jgi:O-acetyl-ADP-ribose deacetylase (regulator of RNase III)
MIRYTQGNLLQAPVEALVNTVNEVGVMGKGIAMMFRDAFPENTRVYEEACRQKEVHVGRMLVTRNKTLEGERWVINFPTKKHWRNPSKIEWIREGLKDLARVIRENGIRSVAVPPLGCGNGRLDWEQVRHEIESALGAIPGVDILVYGPTAEYQNEPKRMGVERLTPARALVAEMTRRYAVLGNECTNLEVHKLTWFLDRSISQLQLRDPLRLRFVADRYGPYADGLRHLLDALDGSYLHCDKRLSDAGPLDLIWFEDSKREIVEAYLRSDAAAMYGPALDLTAKVIDGFEGPHAMELLATVDWLLVEGGCEPSISSLRSGLANWPGGEKAGYRKQTLFDDRSLALALARLTALGTKLDYHHRVATSTSQRTTQRRPRR